MIHLTSAKQKGETLNRILAATDAQKTLTDELSPVMGDSLVVDLTGLTRDSLTRAWVRKEPQKG